MKNSNKKSFDWYGLSQRFSIRKYHFGAASVLLGTALILGTGQNVKANETTAESKTEALAPTANKEKEDTVVVPATIETPDKTPVVNKPELSEAEVAKLKEQDKAKEGVENKGTATEVNSTTDKNKKEELKSTQVEEKQKEKEPEVKKNAEAKTVLEQLTSEAEVLNTTALNFADKKVEKQEDKVAIAHAVSSSKIQIEASKKLLQEQNVVESKLQEQVNLISSAIEAVYTEMKRAGHVGKVEAVLPDTSSETIAINNPINKVVVNDFSNITDEEARAIEKEIRTANPTLTEKDKIQVKRSGSLNLPGATITLANGKVDQFGSDHHQFTIGEVAYGSAADKNFNQLREAINWFDFARATITYADGTKVSAVEYIDNAPLVNFTSSKGRQESGRFTMVRTVIESASHPELVGKKTNDPAFLASGIAKYTLWKDFNHVREEVQNGRSQGRENNEVYEALQEGMRFDVPTKVEGYQLSATVSSLSRKKVETETYTLN